MQTETDKIHLTALIGFPCFILALIALFSQVTTIPTFELFTMLLAGEAMALIGFALCGKWASEPV